MIITTPEDSPIVREILAAQAAAAGRTTREQMLDEAMTAFAVDLNVMVHTVPLNRSEVTAGCISAIRASLTACLSHLDEIERHLPGSGHLRALGEGDELTQGGRDRE